jgi:hypothetical protein
MIEKQGPPHSHMFHCLFGPTSALSSSFLGHSVLSDKNTAQKYSEMSNESGALYGSGNREKNEILVKGLGNCAPFAKFSDLMVQPYVSQ